MKSVSKPKKVGFATRFSAFLTRFTLLTKDDKRASARARHETMMLEGYIQPIYIPRKHTVMNYATQNRLAKARRKAR